MSVAVFIAPELDLSPALERAWLGLLPASRQAQVVGWQDRAARHRSLLGTRLLALALERLGLRARLGTLHYGEGGKPALDGSVKLSISHCEGRVVCSVASAVEVGIDVEAIGSTSASAFPSYFSAGERGWAGDSARRFCVLWTRKEAVAKACGSRGLAAMPDIHLHPGGCVALHEGRRWSTMALPVGPGHVAHLAVGGSRPRVAVHRLRRSLLESRWADGQSDFLQQR